MGIKEALKEIIKESRKDAVFKIYIRGGLLFFSIEFFIYSFLHPKSWDGILFGTFGVIFLYLREVFKEEVR